MSTLKKLAADRDLVNAIDWEMTPEEAVRLYLEWGNNWAGGNYVIRSKNDVTHYFVVNTWRKPVIYLIRRNSDVAEELAEFDLPKDLEDHFLKSIGHSKGVWAPDGKIKGWLQRELHAA